MTDPIERQDAIDALEKIPVREFKKFDDGLLDALISIGQVYMALKRLPSAQPKQRWIPCSEQLPRQGQEVICQCRANMIRVLKLDAYGDWYQDAEHCYMSGFVIAWMPLPEPYAERRNDEVD